MATSYGIVYNRFLSHITDYDFAVLSEDDVKELMEGYLLSSIPKFKKCNSDLSKRDDITGEFEEDLLDIEIEILSIMMVDEWLKPQINSSLLSRQAFGGKEEKFYSQANHLETLMALEKSNRLEARKLIRDYKYRTVVENE